MSKYPTNEDAESPVLDKSSVGRIDECISDINDSLDRTSKLLAEIESIAISPKTNMSTMKECCGVDAVGRTVFGELDIIHSRIHGYNDRLAELLKILQGQLGSNGLKLV